MKKVRIIAALTAALLALSALAGCSNSSSTPTGTPTGGPAVQPSAEPSVEPTAEPAADLLAQIQAKGEIVVAMEGTWAPWTYHDDNGELVGFDTEVAKAVAEKLGVKATFVEGDFDGLLAGVEAGRYDIIVNGVEIDESRQEKYDFSVPYAYGHIAVIVRSDDDSIQTMEDLAGKHTANTITSTYAALAQKYGADVTGVDDLNQTFELLLTKRIDATLNDEFTYYDYMKAHPDAGIKIACLNPDATQIAIPMRKGEETAALRAAIDKALAELTEEGKLTELSLKYFGSDISKP